MSAPPPPPSGDQPPGSPAMQGYPPQQAAPRNGLGTTGLVLGIIGVVFAFIPLLWWIGTILGGLALVFGLIGQSRARKGSATNKGVALTGWALGAVAVILSIVFMVMAALAVNDAVQQLNDDRSLDAPAANSQQNQQAGSATRSTTAT